MKSEVGNPRVLPVLSVLNSGDFMLETLGRSLGIPEVSFVVINPIPPTITSHLIGSTIPQERLPLLRGVLGFPFLLELCLFLLVAQRTKGINQSLDSPTLVQTSFETMNQSSHEILVRSLLLAFFRFVLALPAAPPEIGRLANHFGRVDQLGPS